MIAALVALATGIGSAAPSQYFTVEWNKGVASFRAPSGSPMWSFGVDCTDVGVSRKDYKPSNRSYAAFRYFTSDREWVDDTLGKLKSWGFNSTGGWSDDDLFLRYAPATRLPYFVVLHLGAWDHAPWADMFGTEFARWVDVAAQKQIPPIANDPKLVGYFTDNELGWWDDTLFKDYLAMNPSSPGRKKLIDILKSYYGNDFGKLEKDWVVGGGSFGQITSLKLKAGGNGRKAVDAWTQALGERYYSLMRNTIRKYDKNHLILGDRYCQYYTLPIVRAAAKYVDVVSTNYGADWNDGSITPFFLRTLNQITGKPAIVTEFYMCARDNRSGNKNPGDVFPVVQTQAERSEAFGKYVRSLASLPYTVGAHWFQFYDEPQKGRGDGENYDMGLVDTEGRPYEQLTQTCASLNLPVLRSKARDPLPGSTVSVPRIEGDPMKGLKLWPRDHGVLSTTGGTPFGDLFVTKDDANLYVGLFAMDYMDESLYDGGHISEVDRDRWELRLSGLDKPIVVRYGGKGRRASIDRSGIQIKEVAGLKYTVILQIPLRLLPNKGRITLWSGLDTHGRSSHMEWKADLLGLKK